MALKLVQTVQAGTITAKVYRDADWQEYRTKFYRDGQYMGESCDAHAEDKTEALQTARYAADQMAERYAVVTA